MKKNYSKQRAYPKSKGTPGTSQGDVPRSMTPQEKAEANRMMSQNKGQMLDPFLSPQPGNPMTKLFANPQNDEEA